MGTAKPTRRQCFSTLFFAPVISIPFRAEWKGTFSVFFSKTDSVLRIYHFFFTQSYLIFYSLCVSFLDSLFINCLICHHIILCELTIFDLIESVLLELFCTNMDGI